MHNKHIGSNFDDFLKSEGILAVVDSVALARIQTEKDAARYRYLRDHADDLFDFQGYLESDRPGLDAAVDAAIAKLSQPSDTKGE